MSWEKEDKDKGWTRRDWVKVGVTAGAVGAVLGLGGLTMGQILPPPLKFSGEIRETIQYTKFPPTDPTADLWWNSKAGAAVKVTDFDKEWKGATGVWRGLFQNNAWVPGTGFPCLIIRIKRESTYFTAPSGAEIPATLPDGFSLYFDDPTLDAANNGTRIVVLFDRCVHLCCYPGWHVINNPPPDRNYVVPPPTYVQFAENPVYCICHGSQYDPLLLIVDVNPKNDARYVGAERVHGPAPRALPVIPVKAQGQNLVGGMADPAWYIYC